MNSDIDNKSDCGLNIGKSMRSRNVSIFTKCF